ncbi:ABC transporter permease, partial [Mesorhizobium sp. M1295]
MAHPVTSTLTPVPNRTRSRLALGRLARRPESGSFLGLVAVLLFFGLFGGSAFMSAAGTASWLNIASEIGIIALPIGLLMIA